MKYEDRLDRADRLAENFFVGLLVDSIAKVETSVGNLIRGDKSSGKGGGSRSSSGPHAIANGMQDHLYSLVRPGQSFVAGGRQLVVEPSGGVVDADLLVRSGSDYYAIDIDVTATLVELEDAA